MHGPRYLWPGAADPADVAVVQLWLLRRTFGLQNFGLIERRRLVGGADGTGDRVSLRSAELFSGRRDLRLRRVGLMGRSLVVTGRVRVTLGVMGGGVRVQGAQVLGWLIVRLWCGGVTAGFISGVTVSCKHQSNEAEHFISKSYLIRFLSVFLVLSIK